MTRTTPRILLLSVSIGGRGGIASFARQIGRSIIGLRSRGAVSGIGILSLYSDRDGVQGNLSESCESFEGARVRFGLAVLGAALRHSKRDWIVADHIAMIKPLALVPRPLLRARVAVLLHGEELPSLSSFVVRAAWRHVRVAVTNSGATRRRVRDAVRDFYGPIGILNPSVERSFLLSSYSARRRTSPHPTALIVGRMWSTQSGKGHEETLKAWKTVVQVYPESRLLVAGSGDAAQRYEALAERLGLGGHVEFMGYVDDAHLADIYARAWVFVMPSRQDGYGISFLQAMLHGVPCIGPRDGGIEDLIVHGVNGLLVDPGDVRGIADVILRVLGDPELWREMSRNAVMVGRSKAQYDGDHRRIAELLGIDYEVGGRFGRYVQES